MRYAGTQDYSPFLCSIFWFLTLGDGNQTSLAWKCLWLCDFPCSSCRISDESSASLVAKVCKIQKWMYQKVGAFSYMAYEIVPLHCGQNINIMSTPHVCSHEGTGVDPMEFRSTSVVICLSCHSEAALTSFNLYFSRRETGNQSRLALSAVAAPKTECRCDYPADTFALAAWSQQMMPNQECPVYSLLTSSLYSLGFASKTNKTRP